MPELNQEFYQKETCSRKDFGEDQKILEYIRHAEPEEYDSILETDGSWLVQYHFSPMRASLLGWYPFEADAEVLEVGGGFGALTHLLCEKCAQVTSVEREPVRAQGILERCRDYDHLVVFQCDVRDLPAGRKYDYVTAAGILESQDMESKNLQDYADFLAFLCAFLKPSGKLLLSCKNRMGLRDLCGEKDRKTGIPFDGVNRYPKEQGLFGFTKRELEVILEKAGIAKYKFYYPLPDDQMVQAVYAQQDLPQDSVRDRIIPYEKDHSSVVASELDLMDFCIEAGCLHAFANAFFVECVPDAGACSKVRSALLTVDRGMPAAMAVVREGEYIYKEALYPQGTAVLRRSLDHAEDLRRHGVRAVPHTWVSDRRIQMPYIKAPLLMSVLRDAIRHDAGLFASLMDRIWKDILKSSEAADASENPFCRQWGCGEDWGMILKNLYFDMVPMNCFYDRGEIIYFDQEFVRHGYPAAYTMFRVILYTYIHIPEADGIISRAGMLQKYGISRVMWEAFFQEETAFVASLRKHHVFGHFHEMSQVPYELMRRNALRLAGMPAEKDEEN